MSICSLKSDNRNTAVRRPPCVKGAVTAGDWGIVSDGELDNLRILQQALIAGLHGDSGCPCREGNPGRFQGHNSTENSRTRHSSTRGGHQTHHYAVRFQGSHCRDCRGLVWCRRHLSSCYITLSIWRYFILMHHNIYCNNDCDIMCIFSLKKQVNFL